MFKKIALVLAFSVVAITIIVGVYIQMKSNKNDDRVLTYGLGSAGWGPLFPAQQSSLYAAIIISHVYDSLVGVDNTGGFIPNLAKSWDINEDNTVYTFIIDTDRKFSDGTRLTAQIYKESLQHSLKLDAAAANKSALDVLYALKGFNKFALTGNIEGLEVDGDNILRMRFEKPYRRAIDQLSGTRYGAFIIRNGEYLGTGPYVYLRKEDGLVELGVNSEYPFHLEIKRVRITSQGINDLRSGKIDIVLASMLGNANVGRTHVKAEKMSSLLSQHLVVVVNGLQGKIFSDRDLRKAVQFIVYNYFISEFPSLEGVSYFRPDLQFYPPLFQGRLDDREAKVFLDEGEKFIEKLRIQSKKSPLVCMSRVWGTLDYCDAFKKWEINVIQKHGEFSEIKKILYSTFDADLVGYGVSYASADPDGIYHFLGRNGAIWSPMASRERVEKLIEQGRVIIDQSMVDTHYKNVSRAVLDDVPVIHLGSQNLYLEYNSEIIKPVESVSAKRKAINITLFQWR